MIRHTTQRDFNIPKLIVGKIEPDVKSTSSVFVSILNRANWISKLRISGQAKRLSYLNGRQFRLAVERILAT